MHSIGIDDLLNRRSDLSTFLVHLTRDGMNATAKENLRSILTSRRLEARSTLGWTNGLPMAVRQQLRVVCFSEAPLEHVYSLAASISGRRIRLSTFGLVISKAVARQSGANPVWYVDMTPGSSWAIAEAIDQLRDEARTWPAGTLAHPAAMIFPFIEQMGTWTASRKEFSWEREWRHLGDFRFSRSQVTVVLCPEPDIPEFEALGYRAIDPTWSLERMIGALASMRPRPRLSVAV